MSTQDKITHKTNIIKMVNSPYMKAIIGEDSARFETSYCMKEIKRLMVSLDFEQRLESAKSYLCFLETYGVDCPEVADEIADAKHYVSILEETMKIRGDK